MGERSLMRTEILLAFALGQIASLPEQKDVQEPQLKGVALLRQEAEALRPLVETTLGRSLLEATANLPTIAPRTLHVDKGKSSYFTEASVKSLDQAARGVLTRFPVDEQFFYTTKYGTPLAYVRPFELLGKAGVGDAARLRILDFGYGTIGHLRLLASRGADVTGVDVDPLLPALYSNPEDQGTVKNSQGPLGRIRLIDGRFPVDGKVKDGCGGRI